MLVWVHNLSEHSSILAFRPTVGWPEPANTGEYSFCKLIVYGYPVLCAHITPCASAAAKRVRLRVEARTSAIVKDDTNTLCWQAPPRHRYRSQLHTTSRIKSLSEWLWMGIKMFNRFQPIIDMKSGNLKRMTQIRKPFCEMETNRNMCQRMHPKG